MVSLVQLVLSWSALGWGWVAVLLLELLIQVMPAQLQLHHPGHVGAS